MDRNLLIFGLGYSGSATARLALRRGWRVLATSRDPARVEAPPGVDVLPFDRAAPAIALATHALATAAPGEGGDPVLAAHAAALRAAPHLRWIGYLSTTGVYGDRGGAEVDEATEPSPGQERSRRRVEAEAAWAALRPDVALDLFRTGGIYGPGRSSLDELRAGTARRILKPGHAFGRIHVRDIARAVLAAAAQDPPAGRRVLHLVDDEPAEPADVVGEAAALLGVAPPLPVPYDQVAPRMSEMARSFWAESRRVSSARTKALLGLAWAFPTYREGLRGILAEERGEASPE
ncbi:MAG: SDR family NAD(P)-dependent oxidoreductase [Acetobacteraceae bacterium]|nr:SDR family NAD(P)-dependent oxidoreductase [Acetobacteraceae bacterium]